MPLLISLDETRGPCAEVDWYDLLSWTWIQCLVGQRFFEVDPLETIAFPGTNHLLQSFPHPFLYFNAQSLRECPFFRQRGHFPIQYPCMGVFSLSCDSQVQSSCCTKDMALLYPGSCPGLTRLNLLYLVLKVLKSGKIEEVRGSCGVPHKIDCKSLNWLLKMTKEISSRSACRVHPSCRSLILDFWSCFSVSRPRKPHGSISALLSSHAPNPLLSHADNTAHCLEAVNQHLKHKPLITYTLTHWSSQAPD